MDAKIDNIFPVFEIAVFYGGKTVIDYFKVIFRKCPGGTEKTHVNLSQDSQSPVEIGISKVRNT